MGRRIVTSQLEAAGVGGDVDTYFDRVVKYIPADIVSAWVFVLGATKTATEESQPAILWGAFLVGLVLTALWTWKQTSVPGRPPAVTQTAIATCAFAVWVFALPGGPFERQTVYHHQPVYGSLALVLYTLVVALIVPREG